jgi:hypothetical protein
VLALVLALGVPAAASAGATIVVVPVDGAGEGFNDPTPAAPVGGNFGTTLGEQRLIAFQHAANLWGAMIDSNVTIFVTAAFNPLGANVLGAAGTTFVFANFGGAPGFPGAEFANTWYHAALADKRAGGELNPGFADINAQFSSQFNFYLGLDNNHGAQVDLIAVVLHELGHGLGFANFVNETTGANFAGLTDIYSQYTRDTTNGFKWADLVTDAQRQASALRVDKIVWDGPAVSAAVPHVLSFGRPEMNVLAPAAIADAFRVGTASFGPSIATSPVAGDVVLVDDGNAADGSVTNGCTPLVNAAQVAGRIALVDRGACTFVLKALNAQAAGAIGVIVANNAAQDPPPGLGGTDPTVVIPAVMISIGTGAAIKAQLAAAQTVSVTIGVDLTQRAGADPSDLAQLYATNPVQPGSSLSHFDNIAFRNQLMEPAINPDLTHELIPPFDMTIPQMRDVGWFVDGNLDGTPDLTLTFGRCTSNALDVQLPNGAMLSDQARVWYRDCAIGAKNHGQFVSCVAHVTDAARTSGLISGAQKGAVQQCAAQAPIP